MSEKKINASTVARIAGNILSGRAPDNARSGRLDNHLSNNDVRAVWFAVALARAVVAEVERTEASPEDRPTTPR